MWIDGGQDSVHHNMHYINTTDVATNNVYVTIVLKENTVYSETQSQNL